MPLHWDAFAHSYSYTLILLRGAVTCKFFCAEILLHSRTSTHAYFDIHWQVFYTQILLHRSVSLDTGAASQMHICMLFHRDVFKCACFYTEIFSHKDTFTKIFSCTEMLSYTETLLHTYFFTQRYQRWIYIEELRAHRCHYKQRCFYKGGICTRSCYIPTLLHRHVLTAWYPTADTNSMRKSSASGCKTRNSSQLLMI